MNDYFGGDVFVTLELPSGEVHKFKAITASMSVENDFINATCFGDRKEKFIPGLQKTKFEFVGVDRITTQIDIKENVKTFKKTGEWLCEYCGTPNKRENTTCNKCGAPRSFIYDS